MYISNATIHGILDKLKDIRRVSTMETVNLPQEVKDTTRLWREFWITNPLDILIEDFEHRLDLVGRGGKHAKK